MGYILADVITANLRLYMQSMIPCSIQKKACMELQLLCTIVSMTLFYCYLNDVGTVQMNGWL